MSKKYTIQNTNTIQNNECYIDYDVNKIDYYDVYSYDTYFIRGGLTELPTGMSILKKTEIIMRIGDTLFDKNYNMYLLDFKNMKKLYLQSIKSLLFWLFFWSIVCILSIIKIIKYSVDNATIWGILFIISFIISFTILYISIVSFYCGINCYGIEIYDKKIRTRVNNFIKYTLVILCFGIIFIMI